MRKQGGDARGRRGDARGRRGDEREARGREGGEGTRGRRGDEREARGREREGGGGRSTWCRASASGEAASCGAGWPFCALRRARSTYSSLVKAWCASPKASEVCEPEKGERVLASAEIGSSFFLRANIFDVTCAWSLVSWFFSLESSPFLPTNTRVGLAPLIRGWSFPRPEIRSEPSHERIVVTFPVSLPSGPTSNTRSSLGACGLPSIIRSAISRRTRSPFALLVIAMVYFEKPPAGTCISPRRIPPGVQ
jgi:hypothetical protein